MGSHPTRSRRPWWPLAFLLLLPVLIATATPRGAQDPTPKPEAEPPTFTAGAALEARWDEAAAYAARKNRRVLTIWGRNGDAASEALVAALDVEPLAKQVLYEFRRMQVDATGGEPVRELAERLRADVGRGLPFVTVHDGDGALLASDPGTTWFGDKGFDAEAFGRFLSAQEAEPLDARELFTAAKFEANEQRKVVLVHTSAPWCVWCSRLERFLDRPRVRAILEQDYVLLEIDVERMKNGAEVLEHLSQGEVHGSPFTAVVDWEDRVLETSVDDEGENVGCPLSTEELDWYLGMLERTRERITDEQLAVLRKEHAAFAEPILERMRRR